VVDDIVSQSFDGNGFFFIRPFSERLNSPMQWKRMMVHSESLLWLYTQVAGFQTTKGMETLIQEGMADLIGLSRPLCIDPVIARSFLPGMKYAASSENIERFFAKALLDPALTVYGI
jgi:2,4-dienoyl-CoA reductase-like NADH-dependent reductase (Old Yellow Enzyme family)